jgi:hypothetical protein
MAVPAKNFGLTDLRWDHDTSREGPMDDKLLRWRNACYTGSEMPINMMALAKSGGCIQDITGSWGQGGNKSKSAKDRANSQYMSQYSVNVLPNLCVVTAAHKGQNSSTPVACISRHYAFLEGGGTLRVQFNHSGTSSGYKAGAYIEIIASSSGYLQGSNTYLAVIGNPGVSENRTYDVPANRQHISLMLQVNVDGTSRPEGATINYTDVRISRA